MKSSNIRLGVNIDHIATLRNARGSAHPDLIKAVRTVQNAGADVLTFHLREDRRHIKDQDVIDIKRESQIPLNFEMAITDEMVKIVLKVKPEYVCIVPEKRKELTTEGGLNVKKNKEILAKYIPILQSQGIKTSLFIDPNFEQLKYVYDLGVDAIEIHTGHYANNLETQKEILLHIRQIAKQAKEEGLNVHAGHGLSFDNVVEVAKIQEISELNIGHFIIGESLFCGLENAIRKMKNLIQKVR